MDENIDFSKALEKVQDMLSGEDGQNQLQSILSMLTGSQSDADESQSTSSADDLPIPVSAEPHSDSNSNFDMDMFFKLQKIMSLMQNQKSSPQTGFLQSLKPFLRTERQARVEQAVKLINAVKVISLFRQMNEGGD